MRAVLIASSRVAHSISREPRGVATCFSRANCEKLYTCASCVAISSADFHYPYQANRNESKHASYRSSCATLCGSSEQSRSPADIPTRNNAWENSALFWTSAVVRWPVQQFWVHPWSGASFRPHQREPQRSS